MPGAPDPAWPLVSPGSRPPLSISLGSCLDEIRQEVDRRRLAYPGFVTKGTMTRETMEREIEIFSLIRDELDADAPLVSTFTWHDRIHSLRREINLRRNGYPPRIAKGKMTHEDAAHRIEVMEAIHWRYWMEALASDDPRLLAPAPTRDQFPAGLNGNLSYALAVVARSDGRREFFEERDGWRAAQGVSAAA